MKPTATNRISPVRRRICAVCQSPKLVVLAAGIICALPALRAQVHIPGSPTAYTINASSGTHYIIDAGVQINHTSGSPGAAIVDSANSASLLIENYGMLGHDSIATASDLAQGTAGPVGFPYSGIYIISTGFTTINNHGSIIGAGGVFGDTRAGIALNVTTGAAGGAVYNTGLIWSNAHGIRFVYAGAYVENSGTIIGSGRMGANTSNTTPVEGNLRSGITVARGAGTIANTGLVEGGLAGVTMQGSTAGAGYLITNSGTIIGSATINTATNRSPAINIASQITNGQIQNSGLLQGRYGVIVASTGLTLSNTAGGRIIGTAYHGLELTGANATVLNDASQILGVTRAVSIAGTGLHTVTNRNNATITAASGIWAEGGTTSITNAAGSLISGTTVDIGEAGIRGANAGVVILDNSGTVGGAYKGITLGALSGHSIVNRAGGVIIATEEYGAPDFTTGTSAGFTGNASGGITRFLDGASPGATVSSTVVNAGLISGGNHGIFAATGMHVVNTGTIRATGAQIASVYFAGINASESSLTLGTGSVLEGDVLSAKAVGNRLYLEGAGSSTSNFIGVNSTGAIDAANGFESLAMNGSAWTLSGTISITGNAANALTMNSGTLTIAGDLLMPNNAGVTLSGGGLALDLAGDRVFAGVISGSGAFIHAGADIIELTGANTYTGQTIVASGTLKGGIGSSALHLGSTSAAYIVDSAATNIALANITGNGLVDIQNASLTFDVRGASTAQTYDFAGTLASNGGNQLIKTGAGKLILTQSLASALTGVTEIRDGTLSLSDASFINTTGLILGSGTTVGLIDYTGTGGWNTSVTLAGAGGGFSVGGGTLALTANVGGAGAFVKDGAGALDIRGATFAAGVNATEIRGGELIATNATLRGDVLLSSAGATLVYEHSGATAATDNRAISGNGNLIKAGNGLLNLTGNTTYTGNTIVREGTLQGNIGAGGLQVDGGATYKVADGITNFQLSGVTGNGTVDLNAASLMLDVAAGVTGTFNFSGNLISGNPQSKLVKTGAGTTELLSAVVLQGGVEVQNGTLRLANQAFITTPIVLGTGTTSGLIEYTGATAWSHDITLSGNGGGFSVASGTQAISGFSINGAGDFVKAGAGTLDITAASITDTANGSVRILDGTLRASAAVLKAGGIEIASSAGTIDFYQVSNATYAGAITGPGTLLKTGDGSLTLTGANTYGDTVIQSGLLSGNIGTGILTIASTGTYRVADGVENFIAAGMQGNGIIDLAQANLVFDVASGTSSFSFSGALHGGNQFIKTGSGALTLQSAVALAGGAAIQDGLVTLADAAFLGAPVVLGTGSTAGMIQYTGAAPWNNTIVLNGQGGGFLVAADATAGVSGTIRSTGTDARLIKSGAGTLDVTAATFNGVPGVVARAGTLRGSAATLPRELEALAGAAVEIHETGTTAIWDGVMTGAGDFVKAGGGMLTIGGTLQQTGMFSIAGGGVKLAPAAFVPATARVNIAAGATLDLTRRDQTLASLDNNGAIYLDATVNSRDAKIIDWNTLRVTGTTAGAAAGSGVILVRLEESNEIDPLARTSETLVTTGVANNYTMQLANRSIYGPYEWELVKNAAGTTITLQPGKISPEVAAAGGIDAATHLLGRASLAALSNRLMGARDAGPDYTFQIWGGFMGREDKLKSDLYDGAKARTNGFQAGVEWNAAKAGGSPVAIGFYADQGTSEFTMPGRISESTTKTHGIGAYLSYRTAPFYANLILRDARENYDVRITYGPEHHAFDAKGYSMAASLEIGGVVTRGTFLNIEPQLQITYQRHRIDTFTDTMGRDIDIDTADAFESRVGMRVWRQFGDRKTIRYTPHLRASFVHEASVKGSVNFVRGEGITEPVAFRNDLGGVMGMLDAGVLLEWRHDIRIHATGAWYGSPHMNGLSFNLYASYTW